MYMCSSAYAQVEYIEGILRLETPYAGNPLFFSLDCRLAVSQPSGISLKLLEGRNLFHLLACWAMQSFWLNY